MEDRDVTFNQIQVSIVKCPLPMNIQIPFIFQILSSKTLQMLLTLSRFETKHPVALDATELVSQPLTQMVVEMINIHVISVQQKR